MHLAVWEVQRFQGTYVVTVAAVLYLCGTSQERRDLTHAYGSVGRHFRHGKSGRGQLRARFAFKKNRATSELQWSQTSQSP